MSVQITTNEYNQLISYNHLSTTLIIIYGLVYISVHCRVIGRTLLHGILLMKVVVVVVAGPAFGWGERGPSPGRWLRGGAKKSVTDRPHVIRSTIAWWFPHLQTKSVSKDFFLFGCVGFNLIWCVLLFTYVYSRYALCLLLQILFVAALDTKTRISSINLLLSQYCKASHIFANFYVLGGANCSLCPGFPMGTDRPWVVVPVPTAAN
jgi:hypothetical protein